MDTGDENSKKDLTGLYEHSPAETQEESKSGVDLGEAGTDFGFDSVEQVDQFETVEELSKTGLAEDESSSVLSKVREYSESLTVGTPEIPASYPFTLRITGKLSDTEREKLLDVISRENVGIREADLEPQFASGRILIPRVSEYAAVLIAQTLRSAAAKLQLTPSDDLNSESENSESREMGLTYVSPEEQKISGSIPHPAELIPITADCKVPGHENLSILDAVTATASLKSSLVEAQSSSEYQEILESLQRELKYKAYRKGANAVVNFSVNLTRLSGPTHYKLTVLGSAVRYT